MITANKDIKAVDLVREALEKAKEFEEYHCFISMNQGAPWSMLAKSTSASHEAKM